jgi:hypothetical protein
MSTSFLYGTIPFMKAMERMTNPCFQDKDFAKVMKGKHIEGDPDEFRVEVESAEVLEHVEDDGGMARENVGTDTTDPIATGDNADPTATGNGSDRENVDPIVSLESSARLGRKRVLVPPENIRRGKESTTTEGA